MTDIIVETARRADDAAARISDRVIRTPLLPSAAFSDELGCQVFFKQENLQTTGSFKLRGAMNRLLTLSDEQQRGGCVAASSGNHGAAVAAAMQELGLAGVIFVPEQSSTVKLAAIKRYGGEVRFFGTDGLDTEQHARAYADKNGMTYISPYNDQDVIAGQGSCGVEIIEQVPEIDAAFVAVGGGGLIGGVGSVLKTHNPDVRIVGCQPLASAVMAHSIAAGKIVNISSDSTLSDGTAGGIEADAITFDLNKAVVDEFVLVDESEIAAAMRAYVSRESQPIEGAAGVAIAALRAKKEAVAGLRVVVIICGGNIATAKLEQILRDSSAPG